MATPTQAQTRLSPVHFLLLDLLYLSDASGVAQAEIEKSVMDAMRLPCRVELHEIVNNAGIGAGTYAERVMRQDSPDEPVIPHRYAMTEGRDGLRENYATLCRQYGRDVPQRPTPPAPAAKATEPARSLRNPPVPA